MAQGRVVPMRSALLCRYCRQELISRQEADRENGQVRISLVCPRHGALKKGERFQTGYVGDR